MSPSMPSSVNITFDNMISELGNFTPWRATRSRSRMASAPLGMRDGGIASRNLATDSRTLLPRGEVIRMRC